jgi:hypothetical protein
VAVERSHVLLDTPIKTIGMYKVTVAPHPEVEVKITINVARSADEAAAQARGENLAGPVSDRAEIRAAAEALFDEEAPFRKKSQPPKIITIGHQGGPFIPYFHMTFTRLSSFNGDGCRARHESNGRVAAQP